MLIDQYNGHPSIRWGSPMSVGAWALLIFGGFTFISFLGTLVEIGRLVIAETRRGDPAHPGGPCPLPEQRLAAAAGALPVHRDDVLARGPRPREPRRLDAALHATMDQLFSAKMFDLKRLLDQAHSDHIDFPLDLGPMA